VRLRSWLRKQTELAAGNRKCCLGQGMLEVGMLERFRARKPQA
jgi:hypothetical protein